MDTRAVTQLNSDAKWPTVVSVIHFFSPRLHRVQANAVDPPAPMNAMSNQLASHSVDTTWLSHSADKANVISQKTLQCSMKVGMIIKKILTFLVDPKNHRGHKKSTSYLEKKSLRMPRPNIACLWFQARLGSFWEPKKGLILHDTPYIYRWRVLSTGSVDMKHSTEPRAQKQRADQQP